METGVNRLTSELRRCCAQHVLEEKWLLAPSRRLGQQWVEAVTRAGQPVVNLHLESVETLALLRLAAPEMTRRKMTFLRGVAREVLVTRLFTRLREEGEGYLTAREPSPGLIRSLTTSLHDLRMAGITAASLRPERFEVATKGREVARLLAAYEDALRALQYADYAEVLRLATARVEHEHALPLEVLLLAPEDMVREFRPLERALWDAFPAQQRVVFAIDHPGEQPEGALTDLACLRWIAEPAAAPAAPGDGTAIISRAVGEVNEVRGVLAYCLAHGAPFDEVEILYSDAETYVPLLYDFATRLWGADEKTWSITFAEGIPVRTARSARALLGWLEWVQEDYLQTALAHLIQDGLVVIPGLKEAGYSYSRLAALLRSLPIGRGKDRYLQVAERELEAVARRLAGEYEIENLEDPSDYARKQHDRGQGLKLLHSLVTTLLEQHPEEWEQRALLTTAMMFFEKSARGGSEFDEYTRSRMLAEMRELLACLTDGDVPGLDVGAWLMELVHTLQVNAQGPRPGCIYAAPFSYGGHSGRKNTFLLGLDDGRFSGAGSQDPLLLDGERARLSRELSTAAARLARRGQTFRELLARLRGQVTLSYCCRDVREDRALFPATVVWSAYRILSGNVEGDQEAMEAWLAPSNSFAPLAPEQCLDPGEWWMWRRCGEQAVADPEAVLAAHFPHLGQGRVAKRARESDLFTEYDGFVPEAGIEADPTRNERQVLSASRLETMGRCPFEYYLKYVLEIEPPEEYTLDPAAWLNPAERGALLHSVFRNFMSRLTRAKRVPDSLRDEALLRQIVEEEIEAWQQARPPHNQEVCTRECEELQRIARVFLREEERWCRTSRPVCFEAAIGMPFTGRPGLLDSKNPVAVTLPDGSTIRARARIDRVDQLADSSATIYTIWDYKTGSSRRYPRGDPFRQGRHLQNVLYLALAQARLKEQHPEAVINTFGYFFPNLRDYGARVQWTAQELEGGAHLIGALCRLMASGCFPITDTASDIEYSDYLLAYGDIATVAAAMVKKLQNAKNEMLAPFRVLRGRG